MNFSYPLGKFLLINCLPAMASVSIVLRHFIYSTSSVCLHLLHCVNLICNKLKTKNNSNHCHLSVPAKSTTDTFLLSSKL